MSADRDIAAEEHYTDQPRLFDGIEHFAFGINGNFEAHRDLTPQEQGWLRLMRHDWFADISDSFPVWQQPHMLDAVDEPLFAKNFRRHAASHLTSMQYPHETFKVLSGQVVDANITQYYRQNPPTAESPEAQRAKLNFQRPFIKTVDNYRLTPERRYDYPELIVASKFWEGLRERAHKNRAYLHASRSVFGLIVAYGMTLEGKNAAPPGFRPD